MEQAEVTQQFAVVRVLWISMIGSVAAFAAIVVYLLSRGDGSVPASLSSGILGPVLGGLAVLQIVAGLVVRRSAGDTLRSGSALTEDRLPAYRNRVVIAWALQEGGGLLLVALGYLSANTTIVLGGAGLAVLALAISRPRLDDVGLRAD